MMEEFRDLKEILAKNLGGPDPGGGTDISAQTTDSTQDDAASSDPADDRPMADDFLIESVYEMLREGAVGEDASLISDSFAEIEAYRLPDGDAGLLEKLRETYDGGDFSGMISLLDEAGK